MHQGGGHMAPQVKLFTFAHSIFSFTFPDQVLNKDYNMGFNIRPFQAGFDHSRAIYSNLNSANFSKICKKNQIFVLFLAFFCFCFCHISFGIGVWYSKSAYMAQGSICVPFEPLNKPKYPILTILRI